MRQGWLKVFICAVLCSIYNNNIIATIINLGTTQPNYIPTALQNISSKSSAIKPIIDNVDIKGNHHIRFKQLINNTPVWNTQVILHKKNKIQSWTGHWLDVDNAFIINKPKTINKHLITLFNQSLSKYDDKIKSLLTSDNSLSLIIYLDNNKHPHWAYMNETKQYFPKPLRLITIIDNDTHAVLYQKNILATATKLAKGTGPGGNEKIGLYEYGQTKPNLDITPDNDTCLMQNERVTTVNLNNEWGSSNKAYRFNCFRNANDAANGAASPINDAHYFADLILDMYRDWYHINPIGGQLIMRTHFAEDFENAFWDGEAMTFGDGDNESYTLVSLDIAAHEISHGFTERHSHLGLEGEAGALNEAFSDMASKTTEFFARGSNTWGFGHDVSRKTDAFRYLDDPTKDGESIDNVNDYHDQDVHLACGIYNKVFYLLATYANSNGNDFAWDIHKAFDLFEHANANYWEPNTTFTSAANDLIQSAQDLNYPKEAVLWALNAVGL